MTTKNNTEKHDNGAARGQEQRLVMPIMEHELGKTIFYLKDNRMHSAIVTTRMFVENSHDDWAYTDDQKKSWQRFGPTGVRYVTCHGLIEAFEAYSSRDELLDSIA